MNKSLNTDTRFVQDVEQRLETMRKICILESVQEGRARLSAERPVVQETFVISVERRLGELRALMDLTRDLHALSNTLSNT